jgi:uncharacterized RDD family membrane protein YckC
LDAVTDDTLFSYSDAGAEPVTAAVRKLGQIGTVSGSLVLDHVLAGPLPEAVARSLVEHRVVRRVVSEMLATAELDETLAALLEEKRTEDLVRRAVSSPAVERLILEGAESGLATELTERMVRSPQFRRLLEGVLSSPEIRSALTQQTTSLVAELVGSLRHKAVQLDDRVASRTQRPESTADGESIQYAGITTRGIALCVDAALTQVVFLIGGALTGLIASLFGSLRPEWLVAALAGGAWLLLVGMYFVVFWSVLGQTPGMRLMRLRVQTAGGRPPGVGRSLLRLVGLVFAIVPLFGGIVPVLFDHRRRALHDFVAGTVVVYDEHLQVLATY